MKKVYIMLENSIIGMGGGQMYTKNKIVYMQKKGYDTAVYSGHTGEIVIPELKEYQQNIMPEFLSAPLVYRKSTINRITKFMTELYSGYEEVIFESGIAHMAMWGEIFAEALNAKHMVHLLDERNDMLIPNDYLGFYKFKHERKELSGITSESLKMLFRYAQFIQDENSYWLPSVCQNVVSDSEEFLDFKLPRSDYSLCTIGRLDKPYVSEAAKAYVNIAKKYSDLMFNCVFIGGSEYNQEQKIRDIFAQLNNVSLIITGYMYPIPRNFLEKMDLFVSSAGSAGVSYEINKVTISIDGEDLHAIGVLGYTTQKSLYRDKEPLKKIDTLIDEVLFSDYLSSYQYTEKASKPDMKAFDKHIVFLNESNKSAHYYSIFSLKLSNKERFKKLIASVVGDTKYTKLIVHRFANMKGGRKQ